MRPPILIRGFVHNALAALSLFAMAPTLLAQGSRGIGVQQGQQAASGEYRIALVMGNSAYADMPLKNPVNDARAMARALRDVGFDVIHVENQNQVGMKKAIREFGFKLRQNRGVGLFYYAGHGMQVKGTNYLLPVGSTIASEADVEDGAVNADFVMGQMEDAGNAMNVVILDACRNNPFARSVRSADKGLAQANAPTGTLIAYATAPGSVASDGTGTNGLYTQELLKNIRTPGRSIEEVFKNVRISVRQQTNGAQTPWESSSLVGDFFFSRPAPQPQVAAKTEVAEAPAPAPAKPNRKNEKPATTVASNPAPANPTPAAPAPSTAAGSALGELVIRGGIEQCFAAYRAVSVPLVQQLYKPMNAQQAETLAALSKLMQSPSAKFTALGWTPSADGMRATPDPATRRPTTQVALQLAWRNNFGGNRNRLLPFAVEFEGAQVASCRFIGAQDFRQ